MKTIYFLLLAGICLNLLNSCDDNAAEKNRQDELVGFWKLQGISGGIIGTGYPADFTDVQFNSNGTYRIHNHDEVKGDGRYELATEGDQLMLRLTPDDAINLVFESSEKAVIFERNQLILRDPCCDLYEYAFREDEQE